MSREITTNAPNGQSSSRTVRLSAWSIRNKRRPMKQIQALLLSLSCTASFGMSAHPTAHPSSPLSVSLNDISLNAHDAVIEIDYLGEGERLQREVMVRNESNRRISVDVFSVGDGILAFWRDPDQRISTRTTLAPHVEKVLELSILGLSNLRQLPSVILMENWKELGHIDVLYVVPSTPTLPPEGDYAYSYYASGRGKEWGYYRPCAPKPPVGYQYVATATRVQVWSKIPENKNEPRACGLYAECTPARLLNEGEGVCYDIKVQRVGVRCIRDGWFPNSRGIGVRPSHVVVKIL